MAEAYSTNSILPITINITVGEQGVTGQSPNLILKRISDGAFWTGTGFSNTATEVPMSEVDSVNLPGLYSVLFDQSQDGSDNTYYSQIINVSPDYPVNYSDTLIFASTLNNINPIALGQILASKILQNPAILINSADIASQTTLLDVQGDVDNIEANCAQQSTLTAFQTSATNQLNQILSIIQPSVGANQVIFTVLDQNSNPVPGVQITLKNTTNKITLAVGYTDINGNLTLGLVSGTYNVLFFKAFYTFPTMPYALTVTTNQSVPITATSFQPTAPAPNLCSVFFYAIDAQGNALSNVCFRAKLITNFPYSGGQSTLGSKQWTQAFSDGSGFVSLNLLQGAKYEINCPEMFISVTEYTIPAVTSLDLSTLLNYGN